jgi:hypothetical protein
MSKPSAGQQLLDLFLLRMQEPEHATERPYYTTGSIVAAALMRIAIVGVIAILLRDRVDSSSLVMGALAGAWLLGYYPAYQQYKKFNDRVADLLESTLCGKCRHFDPTSQRCMIYDEHVDENYIACEGESWEPK